MATFTWILLMLFVQQSYCHSTEKHKSHHHTNAKKSFLADAMKEMDYGENATANATTGQGGQNSTKAVAPQENNHHGNEQKQNHTKKQIVNEDHFVARIFPSKVIDKISKKEQEKAGKSKEHADGTPKLGSIHLGDETTKIKGSAKSDESLGQNVIISTISPSPSLHPHVVVSTTIASGNTVAYSNNSKSVSEKVDIGKSNKGGKKKSHRNNIKNAIRLLQAFVEKLLKENETNESNHSIKVKPTMKQSEKKDVLKEALPIHVKPEVGQQSTVISGIKYNLAPVYRIKAKLSKDAANNSNSSPEQQKQQQQEPKEQPEQQGQQLLQQEPKEQPEQQQEQQQLKVQQEEQQKQQPHQEQQQEQQQKNVQNKLQGDIEKLKQEETLLRQSLAEKELEIQKLKLQNSPSVNNASNQVLETTPQTPNITNESIKQDESSSNDDQTEMKFASLKGVPPELLMKLKTILEEKRKISQKFVSKQEVHSRKAFETARKLVKAALAREQLYKAEQDFFEKVKEMMNKTSTANLVKADNSNAQKEANVNNDEGSTIKDYIQQIEEQSQLENKVRRTSPSPLQTRIASNITTESMNDSMSAKAGPQGGNSSQSNAALDLQASAARILKQLNHTKGPDEKNVEAAAHLEEKVAEQQDEMYEKLIRQTLGKGMGGDDEDDEEDDEEQGVARNMNEESRPSEEEMMARQENYGDFQDSDEDAQSRSDIKYVKQFNKNETLPTIDEDSLLSLRNRISRPPK